MHTAPATLAFSFHSLNLLIVYLLVFPLPGLLCHRLVTWLPPSCPSDLCLSAPQRDLPLYLKCLLHLLPFIALFPFCNYFIYLFACLFVFLFCFLFLLISLIISPVPSTVPQTQYALNKYLLNNEWMNHDIAKRASCTQTYIYLNNNWHISVVSQSICV